eukprot:CAMPEP_0113668066 /NCGR_PEP_ID=MMETSP0038_2-20120614/3791_1 /TAXON_ID=2898 /ORGANISM="Cryptomonas paramecium" /LENGTH=205 /DNA_ID=CAMNT_0000583763 /DNA_START=48 /DNA_END=662 /DNA_ORIENTATION=- /assembly_acc=CAM_ASM_000170
MKLFSPASKSKTEPREDHGDAVNKSKPVTPKPQQAMFFTSGWNYVQLESIPWFTSGSEMESMNSIVDNSIRGALENSMIQAQQLRDDKSQHQYGNQSGGDASNHEPMHSRLHVLYTQLLSCVMLPVASTPSEFAEWTKDEFSLLREGCSKCGAREGVSDLQHRVAMQFLDSEEGKGALMAGLNAREELVLRHPFYSIEAFDGSSE